MRVQASAWLALVCLWTGIVISSRALAESTADGDTTSQVASMFADCFAAASSSGSAPLAKKLCACTTDWLRANPKEKMPKKAMDRCLNYAQRVHEEQRSSRSPFWLSAWNTEQILHGVDECLAGELANRLRASSATCHCALDLARESGRGSYAGPSVQQMARCHVETQGRRPGPAQREAEPAPRRPPTVRGGGTVASPPSPARSFTWYTDPGIWLLTFMFVIFPLSALGAGLALMRHRYVKKPCPVCQGRIAFPGDPGSGPEVVVTCRRCAARVLFTRASTLPRSDWQVSKFSTKAQLDAAAVAERAAAQAERLARQARSGATDDAGILAAAAVTGGCALAALKWIAIGGLIAVGFKMCS